MAKKTSKKILTEEVPLEVYSVGNLKFKCHCCGHEHVVEEGVQGGIRFDLYATNKHKLSLACPKCKALLELYFVKGNESPIIGLDGKAMKGHVNENIGGAFDSTEDVEFEATDEALAAEVAYEMEEYPELTAELKEEITNMAGGQDEISVQEENKQEASV